MTSAISEAVDDDNAVRQALRAALRTVWSERPDLIGHGVCERTVVGALAMALASVVAGWDQGWRVDVEYNRWHPDGLDEVRQKFLPDFQTSERERLVLPDLIVHHPGHAGPEHNLLVLEAKKGDISPRARELDYLKLTGFLSVFQYRQAVFLEFDGRGGNPRLQWFAGDGPAPDPTQPAQELVE
ncbi:hypothetical protein [Streptomyces sp. NBC_00696]|uniref:hypothetical protein n=1 Tax=Streptomyces sp. NBC_00696 TaxID=2903672 RepID=UPI002E35B67A|nr:hypothetical protein [Streptomyces sp. NBC_00696]